MERAIPDRLTGIWDFCRKYPYSTIFAILALSLALPMSLRRSGDWVDTYLPAARCLWEGRNLYPNDFRYVYPPLAAFLAGIFLPPPPLLGRLLWYCVNIVALALALRSAWTLAGGRLIEGTSAAPRREHGIAILGLLFGIPFALDALANQQIDLILAALVLGGSVLLERARDWSAALLFGLAAALKCTPLLWAPYLALRGKWIACLLVVITAVGFNLVPDVVVPPHANWRIVDWTQTYLAGIVQKDSAVGSWYADMNYNHSLAGVANRFALYSPTWHGNELIISPRASHPGPLAMKGLVYGTALVLVLLAVLASRRGRQQAASPEGRGLEYSLVLLLMLLLSPMSSKPHFCTMILPGFCLARFAFERGDQFIGGLLAIAGLAVLASNKDLLGEKAYDFVIWYGSVFWACVLLFAGCCYALCQPRGMRSTAGVTWNLSDMLQWMFKDWAGAWGGTALNGERARAERRASPR